MCRFWVVALCSLLLAACSIKSGERGDAGLMGLPGIPGPKGPTGPSGFAGSGQLVFKDANGQYVGPTDDDLKLNAQYEDSRGFHWWIDGDSGEYLRLPNTGGEYFTTADCSGLAYANANIEARMPFQQTGETQYRVIPDSYATQPIETHSRYTSDTDCHAEDGSYALYPLSADTLPNPPIVKPSIVFVGPLHLERE